MTDLDPTLQPTPTPTPDALPPTPAGSQSGDSTGKTFTQEQVNALIGDRLERAKGSWTKSLLEGLGVDSLDTLKARLAPPPQGEPPKPDQAATEQLQKLADSVKEAERKAAEAEQRLQALQAERTKEKRDGAILEALGKGRSTDPKRVLILLGAEQPELVTKVLKEDGTADAAALEALVKAAQDSYKQLFIGAGPGSPSNANGRTVSPGGDAKRTATVNQVELIRRNF